MPRKMARSGPSNAIRAGRGADGGPHLVSVWREGRKSANIRSSSGVIRGIPVERQFYEGGTGEVSDGGFPGADEAGR
jgi:hypothetical protein